MGKDNKFKKLARTLLTTTCLTVAAGAASATTFLEPSIGGGDFSNTLGGANALPAGTDVVKGAVAFVTDSADFFNIPGLTIGATYYLSFATSTGGGSLRLYDGVSQIAGPFGPIANVPYITPVSPLYFGVANNEGTFNYTVTFSQNSPEPGTMGVAGLALAGAWALRRRKKN